MSVGVSIFLSTVLLSVVAVFIATKDRWNWKKIVAWLFGLVFGVPLVAGVILYAYSFLTSYYSDRPRVETSFWDITIDSAKSDVRFRKGAPKSGKDDDIWLYEIKTESSSNDISYYQVGFLRDGKVRYVLFTGPAGSYGGPYLQGNWDGKSQETVMEKFGPPSYVSISEDELERTLSFERFHLVFSLRENRVIDYGIYNPKFGPLKYPKEKKPIDKTKIQ